MIYTTVKLILAIAALAFIGYHSLYFKKLDEVKASSAAARFDAAAYADTYLNKRIPASLDTAQEINKLISLVRSQPEKAFDSYSHALGIGNVRFFLVRGQGEIKSVNENDVSVLTRSDSAQSVVKIATEYVFGNAIRDASGLIDINEFKNTMDFNNVSAEINKVIRSKVLPPFKSKAKQGDTVEFVGAIELNREYVSLADIEVVPISLKLSIK